MRYYSEETVKKMMLKIAHTALEQRAINNGDVFFRQPSIELPDKHGRLIDIDRFIKEKRDFYCSDCEKSICKTCWVFLMIDEID